MARGKYATKAAVRRDAQEVATTISDYQNAVKRLTSERDDLRRRLDDLQRTHQREVRVLKAQVSEGIAPELIVYQRKVDDLKAEVQRQQARIRSLHDDSGMTMKRMIAALVAEGWEFADAAEFSLGDHNVITSAHGAGQKVDDPYQRAKDQERHKRISSATGIRRAARPKRDDPEWMDRFNRAQQRMATNTFQQLLTGKGRAG